MARLALIDGEWMWLERYAPVPEPPKKRRRARGAGSIFFSASAGLWIGRYSTLETGARRYRASSGKTFCTMLKRFSQLEQPPLNPVALTGGVERRIRLLAAQKLGTHSIVDWWRLVEHQRGHCYYCGKFCGWRLTKDHKTPISRGGSDGIENIAGACLSCNSEKGPKTEAEYRSWMEAKR